MSNNFFIKLLTSKSGLSSRRFIALLCVPILLFGAVIGIMSKIFAFYLTAMISMFVIIGITYYFLSWEKISETLKSISKFNFKQNKDGDTQTEITNLEVPVEQNNTGIQ